MNTKPIVDAAAQAANDAQPHVQAIVEAAKPIADEIATIAKPATDAVVQTVSTGRSNPVLVGACFAGGIVIGVVITRKMLKEKTVKEVLLNA